MKKNLITFAAIAAVAYFGYRWYSKKKKEKREAEDKAKAATEPIKVEIKQSSGQVSDGSKEVATIKISNQDMGQPPMAEVVTPKGEGNKRYKKPMMKREDMLESMGEMPTKNPNLAPSRPMFNPKQPTGLGMTGKIKGMAPTLTT